jgi:hypothetical protein
MASIISSDSGLVSGVPGLKTSADATGALQIQTGNNVTAITVDAIQNVGIGTASPGEKLDVVGNIRMSAVPGTNTNAALAVLFQTSAGTIDGGSGLTYNPAGDSLSVNGMAISSGTVSGAGSLATFTCANGAGQYDFRAANDSLRFIAGSSEAMRIISSGNVGIGTSSPADKLHVAINSSSLGGIRVQNTNASGQAALSYHNDAGTQKADVWWNNSGSTLNFRTISTDPMVFYTNNAERMRITSAGDVGIGTASPTQKLDVVGSIKSSALTSGRVPYASTGGLLVDSANMLYDGTTLALRSDTTLPTLSILSNSATPSLRIGAQGNLAVYWQIGRDNVTTGDFIFSTEASEKVRFTNGGNVGIGTTSPSNFSGTNLQVYHATFPSILWGTATVTGQLFASSSTDVTIGSRTSTPLRLTTGDTERMRVDSSGNVLIGQTSVTGDGEKVSISNTTTSGSVYNTTLRLVSTTTGAGSEAKMMFNLGGASTGISYISSQLEGAGYGNLIFATRPNGGNVTERMRINSSGNVGIGTTSPIRQLTLSNSGSVEFVLQDTSQAVDSRNWRIFNTGASMYFGTLNDAGSSGTDVMILNRAGNVGIGGGTPGSNPKLSMYGGIRFLSTEAATNTYTGIGSIVSDTVSISTSGSERMRIDAQGMAMFNTTSQLIRGGETFRVNGGTGIASFKTDGTNFPVIALQNTNGLNVYMMAFSNSTNECGTISTATSSTSYNTTSDYRLKENVAPMTGALAKIAALKPVTYKWKFDGVDGEGFIAHELAEVCPMAVTGAKDAVDEEGNPRYQGIDVSFLVATLTAAIQELKAEFDAYKSTHP